MSYDRREASHPTTPRFDYGDEVTVMDGAHVLFTGWVYSRVGFDDFQGCWRYKVKDSAGGPAKTYNETSLQPATPAAHEPERGHLDPERLAEGLRARLEHEMNKIVHGAGKVTHVYTEGPGSGWQVVFDTEYAALKAYYHYRNSKPNFGKAMNTGGWFVSVSR